MERESLALSRKMGQSSALERFNLQVQACQDEVYNLAYYLMGNAVLACEIVERSFRELYDRKIGEPSLFRMSALQLTLKNCLKEKHSVHPSYLPITLKGDERIAVILVDCLQYSYQDAAFICSKDISWISSKLAAGRYHSLGMVEVNG
jgi:DNA-directed RNA polymerase specialized sigma24 family protein